MALVEDTLAIHLFSSLPTFPCSCLRKRPAAYPSRFPQDSDAFSLFCATCATTCLYRFRRKILVTAKAGDLILWDSRTVHCNTPGLHTATLLSPPLLPPPPRSSPPMSPPSLNIKVGDEAMQEAQDPHSSQAHKDFQTNRNPNLTPPNAEAARDTSAVTSDVLQNATVRAELSKVNDHETLRIIFSNGFLRLCNRIPLLFVF